MINLQCGTSANWNADRIQASMIAFLRFHRVTRNALGTEAEVTHVTAWQRTSINFFFMGISF